MIFLHLDSTILQSLKQSNNKVYFSLNRSNFLVPDLFPVFTNYRFFSFLFILKIASHFRESCTSYPGTI